MPRKIRIGFPRNFAIWTGDLTTYNLSGIDATLVKTIPLIAAQGTYTINGQSIGSNFRWNASPTAIGYRFYWGTSPGSYPNGPVEDTGVSREEPYISLGLAANTTYYVVVRAYNGVGESGNSNEIQVRNGAQIGP